MNGKLPHKKWWSSSKNNNQGMHIQVEHSNAVVLGVSEASVFSKEQMNSLIRFTSENIQSKSYPNLSLAFLDESPLVCHANTTNPSLWIVGSGVSHHMTGSLNLFSNYFPCYIKQNVTIADGSCSPNAGKGTIKLPEQFVLNSVFYVPTLTYN